MKSIKTLVEDIYNIFLSKNHEVNPENLNKFGEDVKECVVRAIKKASEKKLPTLRMSVIGKPDRQLWFELNSKNPEKVSELNDVDVFEPNPEKYLKFLFGDIIEQLLVFLIVEAGHTITHAQEELVIDGIVGHCDPVIDGVPSDIKSASKYSFTHKFKLGGLLRGDDPFGYVGQLSAYSEKLKELYPDEIDPDSVAWLSMNKETGELHLLMADSINLINAESRIKDIKNFLTKDTPPSKLCFKDEPDGKSGNLQLHKNCTFCPFKVECRKDSNNGRGLRAFNYSNGIKYLTHIEKLPKVEEIEI